MGMFFAVPIAPCGDGRSFGNRSARRSLPTLGECCYWKSMVVGIGETWILGQNRFLICHMEGSLNHRTPTALTLPCEGGEHVLRILKSITDGFYGFDAEWRFTFINEAAKRILAANAQDAGALLGQNYFAAFPATRGMRCPRRRRLPRPWKSPRVIRLTW